MEEHSALVYKATLWVNNGLYPQETSVATLYRILPRQRLD